MKSAVGILSLLLPLVAGAGTAGDHPNHRWPVTVMQSTVSPEALRNPNSDSGHLTQLGVKSLQEALAHPKPAPRKNLLQFDLNHRVRLALVSAPRWTLDRRDPPSLDVPLISLRW
ncbi:MAG: hypothetical protein WC485_06755 [Opitutaceae bacterium]